FAAETAPPIILKPALAIRSLRRIQPTSFPFTMSPAPSILLIRTAVTPIKHAFLKIIINGQTMLIPSRVGEFQGEPVVHTHDNPTPLDVRGYLLHFHNTATSGGTARVFTLGDFFEHWG